MKKIYFALMLLLGFIFILSGCKPSGSSSSSSSSQQQSSSTSSSSSSSSSSSNPSSDSSSISSSSSHSHTFGEVTYTWAQDNLSVTASRVCGEDSTHIEEETVNTSAVVTQQQSCLTDELTTYTATFSNLAFTTQVKENIITKNSFGGHDFGNVTYTWSNDNSSVTASRVCSRNSSHVETETVLVTTSVTQPHSCTNDEISTFTAVFTNPAFYAQVKENVVTNQASHTLVHNAAVQPTVSSTGNIEYWYCSVCQTYYLDANANQVTTLEAVTLPKKDITELKDVTFNLGTNTSSTAETDDGNELNTYTETVDGYTLTLTSMSKVYKSYDASGDACLKLGSSSVVGAFSFTVPEEVNSVEILVTGYKAKTSKITVNGGSVITLTKSSSNSQYETITVDTSTNKTVTISTVSGATRCKITSITYCMGESSTPVTPTPSEYTVSWSDSGNGTTTAQVGNTTLTSGSKVNEDTTVTLTFTPASGYVLSNITVNGTPVNVTSSTYELIITKDTTISVTYEEIAAVRITWNTVSNATIVVSDNTGNLSSGCEVVTGSTVTIKVTPESGYIVTVVVNGTKVTLTNNTYSFTVSEEVEIEIECEQETPTQTSKSITFNLGNNGSAAHNDGKDATSYSETVDGYKLSITNGVKMYTGAIDAKGNSAIKLGSSSDIGSFKLTVPSDVTSVDFLVAKYKAKTTKISVNGNTAQTISTSSDDGSYTTVSATVPSSKTITFTTVTGGTRCMINTIIFHTNGSSSGGDIGGGNSGSTSSYEFTDFTSSEKALFTQYIGVVIPFMPTNEYIIEGYYEETDYENGMYYQTSGNTQSDFESYKSSFISAGYYLDETYEDDFGDTWFCYIKNDVVVEMCYYYDKDGYYMSLYVYSDLSLDDYPGGGDSGSGSDSEIKLLTNNGKGLPQGTNGVYNVDFTTAKYVKNVADQAYYKGGCPTTGSPAVLVVPLEFSDVTAASKGYSIDKIKKAFTGTTGQTDYYSVHDYYYESSYGALDLDITILDYWFKPANTSTYYLNQTMDYYGYEVECGDQMIIDEILAYLESRMDLTKFDSDNNGMIDSIVLINTLEIDSDITMKWAYRYWNMYADNDGYYYEYDGVSANDYLWASYQFMHETTNSSGETVFTDSSKLNTYTYIHEFGHVLGADDYYDTSYVNSPMEGSDIMDAMLGDHNAFTKFNYGWLTTSRLVVADTSVTLQLEDFSKNGDSIIFANNWDPQLGAYQEYYIVVYYTNSGLNSGDAGYFSRDGIVVYHINSTLHYDDSFGETNYDIYNTNTTPSGNGSGTENNLIEFVKSTNDTFTYIVGDTISSSTKDDSGNKIAYTFTVDSLTSTTATLTFTKNN